MSLLLKVAGFSLALTLVFTLVANTLPQVEGEPPQESEVELGALTMDSFTALGERLLKGKGTCTLCHNALGRAPDFLTYNMVEMANSRLQDPRYQGKATDAESYIRESLTNPSIYVVKGYGKKGSNDTESPMPDASKPPIQLSALELDAVIAYLQAKDGNPVTVALPTQVSATQEKPELVAEQRASADTPQAALAQYGCAACHTVLDTESPVGPRLTDVGARLDAGQIRESIIDPNARIAEGFAPNIMPADFADKMSAREMEMIVRFLAEQKG